MTIKKLLDAGIKKDLAQKIDKACRIAQTGESGSVAIPKEENIKQILKVLHGNGYGTSYGETNQGYTLNLNYE